MSCAHERFVNCSTPDCAPDEQVLVSGQCCPRCREPSAATGSPLHTSVFINTGRTEFMCYKRMSQPTEQNTEATK